MGTGKTIATLTAITDLFNNFDIGKVLVIAPVRVVTQTWPDEIVEWQHTSHLTYTELRGTPKQRLRAMQENTDIHLIGRELVPWLVKTLRNRRWPYDTVIIDEASSFKNHTSNRFRALRAVLPKIRRIVELTGTPASNGYLNLWAQIFLLDKGERLGRTYGMYRDFYFYPDFSGYNFQLVDGGAKAIEDRIRDKVLRLEYPHSTQPIMNRVVVNLPEKTRSDYEELEKEFLVMLEDGVVAAPSAGVLSMRLHQFANGAIYRQNEIGENVGWTHIHNEKLDALEGIIEETGTPIFVAYNFRHDLERLKSRFPTIETLDAPDAMSRWNAGKIPLLAAHPASAGHGLNLQYGGHTIVWFGLNWSLELYAQFNARLHRQGQSKQVVIHHIIANNTVDETILERLQGKYKTEKELLDAMKEKILAKY